MKLSDFVFEKDVEFARGCKKGECMWEVYVENEDFMRNTNFTNKIVKDVEIYGNVACFPSSFGYGPVDAEILFPDKVFPSCESVQNTVENIIEIKQNPRVLKMTCEGEYFIGNPRSSELIGYELYEGFPRIYNKTSIKLTDNNEWAYGTCKSSYSNLEGATYMHYPDPAVITSTSNSMKSSQLQYGPNKTLPLTVIMISIDSMSRNHFYRKLPKTLSFLQSLPLKKFRVHDYKIHNIIGDNSIPNVYGILTGKNIPEISRTRQIKNAEKKKDLIEKDAIWTDLKKIGWVTMFGTEFCSDYFSLFIGRKPKVDHLLGRFWCAAEVLSGFEDRGEEQRCIGNKNSHFYMLNYTLQYVNNYQGLNKWGHVMVLPAHEDSGTLISTLDADLESFLNELLATKDDLIFFLLADHGPRYGDWKKSFAGAQEHKLPMLITVISTPLLEKIPFSFDILAHNSNRLVTKFDIHKTLRHISILPYFQNVPKKSYWNNLWGAGLPIATSILLEKIDDAKTCESSGIAKEHCSCPVYREIDLEKQGTKGKELIRKISEQAIRNLNWESQTNFNAIGKNFCKHVELKTVEKVNWMKISNFKHHFRIHIRVHEDPDALIETLIAVATYKLKEKPARMSYPQSSLYNSGKIYTKVQYLQILNAPDCKNLPKISTSICLCTNNNP